MHRVNNQHSNFRAKRARYVQRACKECKRRKVKCDGKKPCTRCAGQSFGCIYASSPGDQPWDDLTTREFDRPGPERHVRNAQSFGSDRTRTERETLATPFNTSSFMAENRDVIAEHRAVPEFPTNSLEFSGPSSTEYMFEAVNGNLRAMGMQSAIPDKHSGSGIPSSSTGRLAQYGPIMKSLTMDPLWDMTLEESRVLIDDWIAGLGTVYPIISRRVLMETAEKVFRALNLAVLEGLRERGGSVMEALFNHNTNKLKIVLAIGILKKAGGRQNLAERLFRSTSEATEGLIWNPEGIHGIQLLLLVATYHYHLDEEVRVGRCIAFAARFCLEAGLHRRATLEKLTRESEEYAEALPVFWSVYMYERRLSLGQGIPFTIQDSYIDRSLFTIKIDNPLLPSVLDWAKLAGKTWHLLNSQSEKTYDSKVDDIKYLDYQIMEWYAKLPDGLRLDDISMWNQDGGREPTYFSAVVFVRQAGLRNLIYRPVLQSPAQNRQPESTSLKAIEISKITIRTLLALNEHNKLLESHPMFFQPFLLTAFGTLLLAVINARPEIRNSVREEFDMFLHIFQHLSLNCAGSRRTWQRLQGLRDLHFKLSNADPNVHAQEHDDATRVRDPEQMLSFDDIFPDLADVMATEPIGQFGTESGTLQDFNLSAEEMLDLNNLFNFPFLDMTSLV